MNSHRSTGYVPLLLLCAYAIWFALLAVDPYDRTIWFAENIPIVLIVLFLAVTWRWFRFSNTSYVMMSCLIFLHTIGAHYTFARVPFDWVTDIFGFQRNNFDRLAHFTVGFYAYPIVEWVCSKHLVNRRWIAFLFAVFAIFTVASLYEIIEWWCAVSFDKSEGAAFVGAQGDVWDAQKDMLADGLGALAAVVLYHLMNRRRTNGC
jgi:putative membrane protein